MKPEPTCQQPGCERPARRLKATLCHGHYMKIWRYGDVNFNGWRSKPASGYFSMHGRIKWDKGSASAHSCVVCGGQAKQWAYTNDDPNEVVDANGHRYSNDQDRYVPMCVSCHLRFDWATGNRRKKSA